MKTNKTLFLNEIDHRDNIALTISLMQLTNRPSQVIGIPNVCIVYFEYLPSILLYLLKTEQLL